MDMFDLGGRVAVVTGASSGIGEQCARALHGAGAAVVLVARRRERLQDLARQLPRSMVIAADLTDPAAAGAVLKQVEDAFGRLDVLVNAAGVNNAVAAAREPVAEFRQVIDVNLVAPFALAQASLAIMRTGGGGSIINITSVIASIVEPSIPEASYAASKSGLAHLTRELAVQWARYGVRVNALAPGWFPTEMTAGLTNDETRTQRILRRIPAGRYGRLEELDGPLLLLASDAGSYITGQTITVDGGTSLV